jgi:hypothetical protein
MPRRVPLLRQRNPYESVVQTPAAQHPPEGQERRLRQESAAGHALAGPPMWAEKDEKSFSTPDAPHCSQTTGSSRFLSNFSNFVPHFLHSYAKIGMFNTPYHPTDPTDPTDPTYSSYNSRSK